MVDDLGQLQERVASLRRAIEQSNYEVPETFMAGILALCDALEALSETETEGSIQALAHARFRLAHSDELLDEEEDSPDFDYLRRPRNALLFEVVRLLEMREEQEVRAALPEEGDRAPMVEAADFQPEINRLLGQLQETDAAIGEVKIVIEHHIDQSDRRSYALIVIEDLRKLLQIKLSFVAELAGNVINLAWVTWLAKRLRELGEALQSNLDKAGQILSEIEGLIARVRRVVSLTQKVSEGAKHFLRRVHERLGEKVKPEPGFPVPLTDWRPPKPFRDVDEPWCPEVVEVSPGEFLMGSELGNPKWRQYLVRIAYRLAVGRYPVTFEEYEAYTRDSGVSLPYDAGWGRGRRPVIYVNWEDARDFASWLSKRTQQPYRLLSEAEWEYVARAGTTTSFWWGDEASPKFANYGNVVGSTTEVDAYRPNPFGLHDMLGNVWEWVEDTWEDDLKVAPRDGSARTHPSWKDARRVHRGGCWFSFPRDVSSAHRTSSPPDLRDSNVSFRIARTLP